MTSGNRAFISFYYNDKLITLFQKYTYEDLWITCGDQPIDYGVYVIDYKKYNKNILEDTSSITLKILSDLLNFEYSIYKDIRYELNSID